MYTDRISNRLFHFIEKHLEFSDVGDAENGPQLESYYNGPEWAERLDNIVYHGPANYLLICEMELYSEDW